MIQTAPEDGAGGGIGILLVVWKIAIEHHLLRF